MEASKMYTGVLCWEECRLVDYVIYLERHSNLFLEMVQGLLNGVGQRVGAEGVWPMG